MDSVQTAILNSRFTAIVEEASATIYRTAHTTFVKLIQDYQCALATPAGDMFAYPSQSGVNVFIGLPLAHTLDVVGRESLRPGDIIITNDPYSTDGMVTHMMDVNMLMPIFRDDELIAIAWSFVHASDIGGSVPGSISPAFTEVFQEGLRIPPVKLFEAGQLNEQIKQIILNNTRMPHDFWGDIEAMLSAHRIMEKRMHELCDRYGLDAVRQGSHDVIDLADRMAREIIRELPDG
jgi:N-methylhydantoinase B